MRADDDLRRRHAQGHLRLTPRFGAGLWDCELDCGRPSHVFATRWFAWDISGGRSRQIENGDPTASFNSNLASSACEFDPAATKSIYRPQWTQTCYDEAYDPTTMELSRIRASRGFTAQVNLQLTGAIGQRYSIGNHSATIRVWRTIPERAQVRRFGEHGNRFERDGAAVTIRETRLRTNSYYDGSYPLDRIRSLTTCLRFTRESRAITVVPDDPHPQFDLVEKVSADM